MDRNYSVVGFLGIDKYEYIIYLSRVLYHQGKKVLLVDCSETGALTAAIPFPKNISNSMIEYCGVFFMDRRGMKNNASFLHKDMEQQDKVFDYVLIDYGFYTDAKSIDHCNHIVCVTDPLAHNIGRLASLEHLKEINTSLIIKNYVNSKITPNYIIRELGFEKHRINHTYVVYLDEVDAEAAVHCQYDGSLRFTKLTLQTKYVIKGLTKELLPEVNKKEIYKAYNKAKRGV